MDSATRTPAVREGVDMDACRSWINKYVKDAYEQKFGLVHGVVEDPEGRVRLLARFPGEVEDRRIALEPVADGHYLYGRDVKARYRRLSERDLRDLQEMARRQRDGLQRAGALSLKLELLVPDGGEVPVEMTKRLIARELRDVTGERSELNGTVNVIPGETGERWWEKPVTVEVTGDVLVPAPADPQESLEAFAAGLCRLIGEHPKRWRNAFGTPRVPTGMFSLELAPSCTGASVIRASGRARLG